jgi:hypothetical protein
MQVHAASAWLISPAVTCRKISHLVSADRFVARRRASLDVGLSHLYFGFAVLLESALSGA